MIGSVVGSYKITEKIGEGGMGAVFKGIDVMLEREVAIKVLRPELARQPQIVERFRTEAVTLAKLNHPYIATLYSFLRQVDDFYMVMEYVRGETLDSVIKRSGALAAEAAIGLFCQALEGIEQAHRLGIIHRDIKPANMMLTHQGTIKVMDFGIARVLGADRMTRTGHLIGTIEYMSPEHVKGEEVDARSDVYSLGILLYEMLTGRVPFTSTSEYELMKSQIEQAPPPPRAFASHVPLRVEQVIMRALAKKPEARHQSAGEFRTLLLGGLRGETSAHQPASSGYAAPSTRVATPSSTGGPSFSDAVTPVDLETAALAGTPLLRETRLAKDGVPPTYIQSPAHNVSSASARLAAEPLGSLVRRLNWKHYSAAGVFVLILLAVPLALIVSSAMNNGTEPQPAAAPLTPTVQPPPPTTNQTPAVVPSPAPPPVVVPGPAVQQQQPAPSNRPGARRTTQAPSRREPVAKAPPKPEPKQEEPQKKKKWWQKIPDVVDKVKRNNNKTKQ